MGPPQAPPEKQYRRDLEEWKEEKRRKLLSFGKDHKATRLEMERIKEELALEGEKLRNGFKKLNLRDDYALLNAALLPVGEKHQALGEILREVISQYDFEPTVGKRVSQRLFDDPQGHWKLMNVLLLFFMGAFYSWILLDAIGLGSFIDNALGLPAKDPERLINPYHILFHFLAGCLMAYSVTYRVLKPKVIKRAAVALLVTMVLLSSLLVVKPSRGTSEAFQPHEENMQKAAAEPTPTPDPNYEWAKSEFQKLVDSKVTKYEDKYYLWAKKGATLVYFPYDDETPRLVEMLQASGEVQTYTKLSTDDVNNVAWRGNGMFYTGAQRVYKKGEGWTCYEQRNQRLQVLLLY